MSAVTSDIRKEQHAFMYAFAAGLGTCLARNGVKPLYERNRALYEGEFQYSKLPPASGTRAKMAAVAAAEKFLLLEPAYADADNAETIAFSFDPPEYPAVDLLMMSTIGWRIAFTADRFFKMGHIRIGAGEELDFGKKWFDSPVSEEYRSEIERLMLPLKETEGEKWEKLFSGREDKFTNLYRPVTECFLNELENKLNTVPSAPQMLIKYYFGNIDYYRVSLAPKENKVSIQAFNPYGTLNRSLCPDMKFPSKVIDAGRAESSSGVLSDNIIRIVLDEGWVVKMRIHHSSSKIVPRLTVDVTLDDSTPYGIYKTAAIW